MRHRLISYIPIGFLAFAISGCAAAVGAQVSSTTAPIAVIQSAPPGTGTPSAASKATTPIAVTQKSASGPTTNLSAENEAQPTVNPLLNSCELVLDSRDLTGIFAYAQSQPGTHTELERGTHRVGPVDQLPFSNQNVTAQESSCTEYIFFSPGTSKTVLLQVTYWLDIPDQAAKSAANQAWKAAAAKASQTIATIGDGAFYLNGDLSFKKGAYYMTINVMGTQLDPSTPAGVKQQLSLEETLARDAIAHLH